MKQHKESISKSARRLHRPNSSAEFEDKVTPGALGSGDLYVGLQGGALDFSHLPHARKSYSGNTLTSLKCSPHSGAQSARCKDITELSAPVVKGPLSNISLAAFSIPENWLFMSGLP